MFNISVIILAGGKSTRMQFNKEYLKVDNEYLIFKNIRLLKDYFKEIIIVTNNPDFYVNKPVITTKDILPSITPLAGLHSGLLKSNNEYNLLLACDMPNINIEFIKYIISIIKDKEAYIAQNNNYLEPFYGIYSKSIISKIESVVKNNELAFQKFIKTLDIYTIDEKNIQLYKSKLDMFVNLNYPEDL